MVKEPVIIKSICDEEDYQIEEEVKHQSEDHDVIREEDIVLHVPKSLTGHQKYTDSLPKKKSQDGSVFKPSVSSMTTSTFDRNSFQIFQKKLTKVYRAEAWLHHVISDLNKAIDVKAKVRREPHISKDRSMEKWVDSSNTK